MDMEEFVERRDGSFYLIGSRVPLAHVVREFQQGELRRKPTMDFLSANQARRVPDPMVLAFAAKEGRILVSHDFQTMPRHLPYSISVLEMKTK